MKKCPYCAEDIQDKAKKCKHCGEWLSVSLDGMNISDEPDAVQGKIKKDVVNASRETLNKTLPKGKTIEQFMDVGLSDPDCQEHVTEQHIKEELDRLNRELELLEDPATINSFGQMFFDGDGVPQDYIAAANWFRIAAEQGYTKAQHNLALMYQNGQGVSQDYAEAAKWYHMAAEQGLTSSQNNLGCMYETGDGVTQDHAEAIKWYRRAAENGDEHASSNLNRLEARTNRDKYHNIVFAFIDLMEVNSPLIGDCSMLPYPKKTILYAIYWVIDYYTTKRETTTDRTLHEAYDQVLSTLSYLITPLARDWQEIDPEDKDAIAKLAGYDSFPDWALPLKLKYIDEEKASKEALEERVKKTKDGTEDDLRRHGPRSKEDLHKESEDLLRQLASILNKSKE